MRWLVLLVGLGVGCVSRPLASMPASQKRVHDAVKEHSKEVAPPSGGSSTLPQAVRPEAPCVRVADCRIVARHRLASHFARSRGYHTNAQGLVASRYSDWHPLGRAQDTFFLEVTEACGVGRNFYIESHARIWLQQPQSCRPETCARSTGWHFVPIEARHNVRRFRPIGNGFFEDGRHVFNGDEILDIDDVDRATFHVCAAAPADADGSTFYPSAEDSRGTFGRGDCGDLIRAR